MKKIIEFFGGTVFKDVGKVLDDLFTSDEERIEAKNKVFKILQEKELQLQKMQTDIILSKWLKFINYVKEIR